MNRYSLNGQLLKAWRLKAGLSFENLANQTGRSVPQVKGLENGNYSLASEAEAKDYLMKYRHACESVERWKL